MKILIDTNILIPLEDAGRKLDSKFAQLKRMVDQLALPFCCIRPDELPEVVKIPVK